jgi:hypothetical protein
VSGTGVRVVAAGAFQRSARCLHARQFFDVLRCCGVERFRVAVAGQAGVLSQAQSGTTWPEMGRCEVVLSRGAAAPLTHTDNMRVPHYLCRRRAHLTNLASDPEGLQECSRLEHIHRVGPSGPLPCRR